MRNRPYGIARFILPWLGAVAVVVLLVGSCRESRGQSPTPAPTPTPVMCIVNPKSEASSAVKPGRYKGKVVRFCCESCRYQFAKKPWKYVKAK